MKLFNSVGSRLLSLSGLLLIGTTAIPTAQGAANFGCPDGYACIYGEGSSLTTAPTNKYYTYGGHPLYNQYNSHYIYNNQTAGAIVQLCYKSNGTDCPIVIPAGAVKFVDLTPINSIKLG